MKKLSIFLSVLAVAALFSFTAPVGKLISSKTHIKFFSHTGVEDIEAVNTTAVSTINTKNGNVVFSVPMQGFEFKKSLMQRHFNGKKFLRTKKFPKAKLKAKITNLSEINFSKNGTYAAKVEGFMTIKGSTKSISETATITVAGRKVSVISKFNITLADYGVTFVKGKPSRNIAKIVQITMKAEYPIK